MPTGYPTIHGGTLSVLWKRFHVSGFDITYYPRRPDIYFNKGLSISGRIAALIEAKKLIEADKVVKRKRKACEIDEM